MTESAPASRERLDITIASIPAKINSIFRNPDNVLCRFLLLSPRFQCNIMVSCLSLSRSKLRYL